MEEEQKKEKFLTPKILLLFASLVIVGFASGYFLSTTISSTGISSSGKSSSSSQALSKGQTVGSDDTKTFSDTAEGVLKEGGFEGEGAFHLERPGGPSQFVYLTSSIIDLSQFKDKKVKVWGKTEKPQKVGWLMDVGRLQIL